MAQLQYIAIEGPGVMARLGADGRAFCAWGRSPGNRDGRTLDARSPDSGDQGFARRPSPVARRASER